MAVTVIPCPVCGLPASRLAVYADQYIQGETVARGRTMAKNEALNKHGQIRLSTFVEAQHELIDNCERQHIEPPDTLAIGKQRAKVLKAAGVTSLAQIE
jgi:hypothetical protein